MNSIRGQFWEDELFNIVSEELANLISIAEGMLRQQQYVEAENIFRTICGRWPEDPVGYNGLGIATEGLGRLAEACLLYEKAISFGTNTAPAWNNLGKARFVQGRVDDALHCYQEAVAARPDFTIALTNLGHTYCEKLDLDSALDSYERTLYYRPEDQPAHWNRALVHLLRGNYEQGFLGYEWRRIMIGNLQRVFAEPLWDGFDIEGKTILLHAEQGFGDTIQFIRFADLVAQRGARVLLDCQPELMPLLQGVRGLSELISRGNPLPAFDTHCPLPSLPWALRMSLGTIPASVPYVHIDEGRSERWAKRLAEAPRDLRIGISWSGAPRFAKDADRSTSPEQFERIAQIPGVTLFNLQKDALRNGEIPLLRLPNVIDFTAELTDFAETGALIRNLDLVISVDTVIAHLAGALGKPVWTLLPFLPDWRWLLDRADSPWYPSMRLFRQPSRRDWTSVFMGVANEIARSLQP